MSGSENSNTFNLDYSDENVFLRPNEAMKKLVASRKTDKPHSIMRLTAFQPTTYVSFGNVRISQSKVETLILENPNAQPDLLSFDLMSLQEKGIEIISAQLETCQDDERTGGALDLQPNSQIEIEISWSPKEPGNFRVPLTFTSQSSGKKFQAYIIGYGISYSEKKVLKSALNSSLTKRKAQESSATLSDTKRTATVSTFNDNPVISKPITRHPINKLKLKPKQQLKPLKTMQFLARNDMYDEYWATKQENAFSKWINYEFSNGAQSLRALTGPSASLSEFSRNMQREQIRRGACLMYQSEPMRAIWQKLEMEIDGGKFVFRKDYDITSDLGLREKLSSLILNYNPSWLILGLEVVLGKTIPEADICQLTFTISNHFLTLCSSGATNKIASQKSFLKRFFMLVIFLDKAKLTRLLPGDPCLFSKEAQFKSSRDILLNLANYLSGEGDITRHLLFFGYAVCQKQNPIDELDFTVNNLATDLRDGIRLGRLIEIETCDYTVVQQLKYPAQSKQIMLSNMLKIFEVLEHHGINLKGAKGGGIEAKDIVEGHREKTLGLLWKIIFQWKISSIVPLEPLKLEIVALKRDYVKKFGSDFEQDVLENMYFQSEYLSELFTWARLVCALHNFPIHNFTSSFNDGRALCLILSHYHPRILKYEQIKFHEDIKMQPDFLPANGWISFSPRKKTQEETLTNYNFKLFNAKLKELGGVPFLVKGNKGDNSMVDEKVIITTMSYMISRLLVLRKETRAALKIQEFFRKTKYRMDYQKRREASRKIYDFCSRIIIKQRLSKDLKMRRAAIVYIQRFWRGHRLAKEVNRRINLQKFQAICRGYLTRKKLLTQYTAALTIQKAIRDYRERKQTLFVSALIQLQACARGYLARERFENTRNRIIILQSLARKVIIMRQMKKEQAVVKLQASVRRFLALKQYQKQRDFVVSLQAVCKGYLIRNQISREVKQVIVIQSNWRMYQQKIAYGKTKTSIIAIQSLARGYLARCNFENLISASRIISWWRMRKERNKFLELKRAVAVVSEKRTALLLSRTCRDNYLRNVNSVIALQSFARMILIRKHYENQRKNVVTMQAATRMLIAKKRFKATVAVIRQAQIRYRANKFGHAVRQEYLKMQSDALAHRREAAVIKIQKTWKMFVAKRQYHSMLKASSVITSWTRMVLEKQRYKKSCQRIIKIQSMIRGYLARKEFEAKLFHRQQVLNAWVTVSERQMAAIKIQRKYRLHIILKKSRETTDSVIKIQSAWRGHEERKKFRNSVQSIISIQRMVKQKYKVKTEAARMIQNMARAWLLKSQIRKYRRSILTIQSVWRGYVARRNCSRMLKEVRERLEIANAQVREENKIGNRARYAVDLLMRSSNLSTVMKACEHLETVTRLSKEWCLLIVNHDAIAKLYDFIKTCNRSKPHLEVLKIVVKVLFNLCQYPETAEIIFGKPEMNEILLDLLQTYRETEVILKMTLQIIWIECQYGDSCKAICKNIEMKRRLTSVGNLLEKKMLTDSKLRKQGDGSKQLVALIKKILSVLNK